MDQDSEFRGQEEGPEKGHFSSLGVFVWGSSQSGFLKSNLQSIPQFSFSHYPIVIYALPFCSNETAVCGSNFPSLSSLPWQQPLCTLVSECVLIMLGSVMSL